MKPSFYQAKSKLSNNRQKNSANKIVAERIEKHIKEENYEKEKIERLSYEQREWIRIRDEWRCQLKLNGCRENTRMPVQIHHIVPWDYAYYKLNWPKKYIDSPENTITLCYACHAMIHTKRINAIMKKAKYAFVAEQAQFENPCWFTAFDRELKVTAIERTQNYILAHPDDPFPTFSPT